MSSYVEGILSLLEAHPYLWLFPLAVAEGPLVAMVAGSMVSLGLVSWPLAYPLVVAADLVGDTALLHSGALRAPSVGAPRPGPTRRQALVAR
jgi:hypothetical protein